MTRTPFLQTPLTYYGGKITLLPHLLPLVEASYEHTDMYCEPYMGGGALYWAKKPHKVEVVNDINDLLINFYEVISNDQSFERLEKKIKERLVYSETIYKNALKILRSPKNHNRINLAYAFYVVSNMSHFSDMNGGIKFCNGTSGSDVATGLANKIARFDDRLKERIRHTQISCREALQVINMRNTARTLFYLDPPYVGADHGHYKNTHFTEESLHALLNMCERIKGRFILSHYWTTDLLKRVERNRWEVLEIDRPTGMAYASTQKGKRKLEVIVYNFKLQKGLFD